MNHLFPGFFGLPEEATPSTHVLSTDGSPTLLPAGAMYSTCLQLRGLVETEKLERAVLKQLVQRLQRNFAPLQPQLESLDQPTTSKSSSLETKLKNSEKRLSTETCRIIVRLNILQHQLSSMGGQICQFEHSNFNFFCGRSPPSNLYLSPPDYGI